MDSVGAPLCIMEVWGGATQGVPSPVAQFMVNESVGTASMKLRAFSPWTMRQNLLHSQYFAGEARKWLKERNFLTSCSFWSHFILASRLVDVAYLRQS